MTFKETITSKMFWTGIATIATAVTGFIYKQIDVPTLVAAVIAGVTIIFTKSAIVKSGPPK